MKKFKFLSDNHYIPTEDEISMAIDIGRRAYIDGHSVEYVPFLTPELISAFEQGWELEQDYAILREALRNAQHEN